MARFRLDTRESEPGRWCGRETRTAAQWGRGAGLRTSSLARDPISGALVEGAWAQIAQSGPIGEVGTLILHLGII